MPFGWMSAKSACIVPPGRLILDAMNPFDVVLLAVAVVAVVSGFSAGLLRGLATILAYVIAAPVALAASPLVSAWLAGQNLLPPDNAPLFLSLVPLVLLLVIGIVLGALMRGAVGGVTGGHTVLIDRVLGALLGLVRVGLIAVLLELIFERIMPRGQEPDWFVQSRLRPYLSAAAAAGLRALPPETANYIDRLKREHGL
jgi:membrane protein required for colicin V production